MAATLLPVPGAATVDCPLAAVLTAAAGRLGEPDLVGLANRLTAPIRVRVGGRPGPAVTTAVKVLRAAGVTVSAADRDFDIEVQVIEESVAEPDGRPELAVLNEPDLIGSPAAALHRCREIRERTGITTVALATRAAAASFGTGLVGDDLIAMAETMGASGVDPTTLRAALRRASGVDVVCEAINRAAAPVRYRRVQAVLAELAARAVGSEGARLASLIAGDDVVLCRMLAAAEVIRDAGIAVPTVPSDPLAAAIRWQRYAAGPVSDLHRACGADLTRGALRLWDRQRPEERTVTVRPVVARRAGLQQARIEAAAGVRSACTALRAELREAAAQTSRATDFIRHAQHRLAGVAADSHTAVTAALAAAGADPGWTDPPALPDDPPVRAPALEGRLATLLGLTFGAGAGLTLGRLLTDLLPRWSPGVAAGCAAAGLAIGLWVVRARRLLSERAAADRWVSEVTAGLRWVLEDQVTARFAAAEVTLLTSGPFDGSPRR